MIDRDRVLQLAEYRTILRDLTRRAKRSKTTRRKLTLFCLACCCGLRVSEITALTLVDLRLDSPSPSLRVRCGKGGKSRTVPLTWDAGTLADLVGWVALRRAEGAGDRDLLLVTRLGRRISRGSARRQFISACRSIGRRVTIHAGRHTFVSRALHEGVPITMVARAAGHASLHTTSQYAHVYEEEGLALGSVFA